MRTILLAGAALALASCGGGETEATDANALGADNMAMDANMTMDPNMSMDMNGAMDANGAADANAAADTANLQAVDAVTNDADTNLANGL